MKKKATKKVNDIKGVKAHSVEVANYVAVLDGVVELLESARRTSARATNAIMTATYWEVGRRIVECEQGGKSRAEYGDSIIERLSSGLSDRVGRGYSARNLRQMRAFYLGWQIWQTVSAKSVSTDQSLRKILQTLSAEFQGHLILRMSSAESAMRGRTPSFARYCEPRSPCRIGRPNHRTIFRLVLRHTPLAFLPFAQSPQFVFQSTSKRLSSGNLPNELPISWPHR